MLLPLLSLLLFWSIANADVLAGQREATIFPDGRIIGGENAVIESFPYQISLEYLGHHVCGGSIISEDYVITAGHCTSAPAESLTIRAGSSLRGQGGSVHHVDKVVRHEKYSIDEHGIPINDLTILKVKEAFVLDDARRPIKLFEPNDTSGPGEKAVITGWGDTGKGLPVQLQTVAVPIVAKDLCDKAYEAYGGLPAGQICAAYYGVGGKDACQGDSGGPLAIDGRLAGIVSWGNGCAEKYYPGVYTEIAYFRSWINEHAIIKAPSTY